MNERIYDARELGPGHYAMGQLAPGDRIHTGTRQITAQMIDDFAALSGDHFEIHMDRKRAQAHGFEDRVAHGLLVLSVVDGLKNQAAAQFKAIASLGWSFQFKAPVLAGDTIGVTITIEAMRRTSRPERGILTLRFDVQNQRGETVQTGENRLMVYS